MPSFQSVQDEGRRSKMGKYVIVIDGDDAQVVESVLAEGTQWSESDSPLRVTIALELTFSGTTPVTVGVFDEDGKTPLLRRAYLATADSYVSDGLAVEDEEEVEDEDDD